MGRCPLRLAPIAILACLLTSCSGDAAREDTLERMDLGFPRGAREIVVSLRVQPTRSMAISAVDPVVTPGVKATYLGYVTRCTSFCGVHAVDARMRRTIESSVEGTIPIVVTQGAPGPHLILHFALTEDGREMLRSGRCIAVRGVDLTPDSGAKIRVTRQDVKFLWTLSEEGRPCKEKSKVLL